MDVEILEQKIYIDVGVCKLLCKHSLCVLLQDDQSTPWSSSNAKCRMGSSTYPLNTKQHFEEKTHYKKRMTEANTLGTITIPKYEHWNILEQKERKSI